MKAQRGNSHSETMFNQVRCRSCGQQVDDRAPACPLCGAKLDVEHPADITPVRNDPKAEIPASQDEFGDR